LTGAIFNAASAMKTNEMMAERRLFFMAKLSMIAAGRSLVCLLPFYRLQFRLDAAHVGEP
jgi:hypothetical protein